MEIKQSVGREKTIVQNSNNNIFNNKKVTFINNNQVEYLQFMNLKKYDNILVHCFTTRNGGMDNGKPKSMNLGFNKGDTRETIIENYKRISDCIGINYENMVLSSQIHDIRTKAVGEMDRGKGITQKSDIIGYDALMTDRKGVALVTFYADCVPVLLLDPQKKVIASAHSGWRGTVNQISTQTIIDMSKQYGSAPKDIEAAIGPSIGQCCFEVGEEVYNEFKEKLPWSSDFCKKSTSVGKWNINLQAIIKQTLLSAGILPERICNADICTKCNNDIFFSYRGDNGKTGSLAAIMQLI